LGDREAAGRSGATMIQTVTRAQDGQAPNSAEASTLTS
jgi:hypothetical protein